LILLCFFFSSRRRHTRSYGDWSSDVCSSDLELACGGDDLRLIDKAESELDGALPNRLTDEKDFVAALERQRFNRQEHHRCRHGRSEERRVGKECRVWWGREG